MATSRAPLYCEGFVSLMARRRVREEQARKIWGVIAAPHGQGDRMPLKEFIGLKDERCPEGVTHSEWAGVRGLTTFLETDHTRR